jgi:transcriptional regulator with XRE-family HTH domain
MNSTFSRGFIGNIESKKTHQTFSLGVLYYISTVLDIPIELLVKENIDNELNELGIDKNLLN